jgi:acyl-CoA synthetase (AMP-forming)/AMP-acid ligase II
VSVPGRPPTFNLADLFETVAATVPDREALVVGLGGVVIERRSYAQLDQRANQVAHVLIEAGIGPGDRVGLHLFNGAAFIEVMLATLKVRAISVNCNFRSTAEELAYVLGDTGAQLIVTDSSLVAVAAEATGRLDGNLRMLVADADEYRDRVASAPVNDLDGSGRSGDDHFLLTTGGTTGRPKGVVWRHHDLYVAALGGRGTPSQGVPAVERPEQVVDRALGVDPIRRRLPLCPLIHGGGMWIALQSLLSGGTCVIAADRHFDATDALDLMESEHVELVMAIGDAIARPLADELAAERSSESRWPLTALRVVASGGAVLSPTVRDALRSARPHVKVVDTFGASETGGQGQLRRNAQGLPVLVSDDNTAVFDDHGERVEPGTGVIGLLGRSGAIPLGYLNDPDKTAATFRVIGGRRWVVPGDRARVEADGSIVVLGRGSQCINTGGEKVFPEEVEAVCKAHPAVFDALVVGVADERFGERVVAVIALREAQGAEVSDAELTADVRRHLAGYKVPRRWIRVPRCERLATGKPDYRWARAVAEAAMAP